MLEQTARDIRKHTAKVLDERVDHVAQIMKATDGRTAEVVAREIVNALEGDAVMGFTFTRPNKTLIINGVRESPDSARLSGGEGTPVPVLVLPLEPCRASRATKKEQ